MPYIEAKLSIERGNTKKCAHVFNTGEKRKRILRHCEHDGRLKNEQFVRFLRQTCAKDLTLSPKK